MRNNNVYVRSNKSIKSISLVRILLLLPLIVYGVYKHGIYLYINKYVGIFGLLKPIIIILIGGFIGMIVNIIYEYLIKKHKDKFLDVIFSSFHIEYGMILGCISSINVNLIVFSVVAFVLLFISKFIKNRINIIALMFIAIYVISYYFFDGYSYLNAYDTSKMFSLDFMDYIIGKGSGGIATTNIILVILAIIGMTVSTNTKTNITISSITTLMIVFGVYAIISETSYGELLLNNSYIFVLTYVSTDYLTSSYTPNGMITFGILLGLSTFGFYFVNPILAPYIATIIISLFNNLIDRIVARLSKSYKES